VEQRLAVPNGYRELSRAMTVPEPSPPAFQARASRLLKVPAIWIAPTVLASILVFVLTLVYFGSLVDPAAHLRGLPVPLVNQDLGGSVGAQRVNLGQQVDAALTGSSAVSRRLTLRPETLATAGSQMNRAQAYATIVIPPGFTNSLLAISGVSSPGARAPVKPTIQLLTNPRAGTLGVTLASSVVQPAVGRISVQIGQRLLPVAIATGTANAATRALLTDPVTLSQVAYRPLPPQSALGLSAFYVALLTIMCGFLGAIIVNSSVDAALGYATTEIGPRWHQQKPVSISRWQTLLIKWALAVPLTAILTGLLLGVAIGILGMDAPYFGILWPYLWLAAAVVAVGTLVLFAALGTLGQLIALLIFIYFSLASSGGTVPLEALSGFYRFLANFEPLRQVLDGVRAILYFDAQGAAGLTRGLAATGAGLVFWVVLGTVVTNWYDRRGLYRIQPELLAYVQRATEDYFEHRGDGSHGRKAGREAPTPPASPPARE
jgi:YhgE/Pip-like protein